MCVCLVECGCDHFSQTLPPPFHTHSLSTRLRSIPAADSESRALFGLDPTHLAELALRDATRAADVAPAWPRAAAARGRALFLLERFTDARAAHLDALALDPAHEPSLKGLAESDAALGGDAAAARTARGARAPRARPPPPTAAPTITTAPSAPACCTTP